MGQGTSIQSTRRSASDIFPAMEEPMRRRWSVLFLLLAAMVVAPTSVSSGEDFDTGVLYGLTADSAWLEGCIVGPCLCPVALLDDLTGDFVLVELPTLQPGPWRLFEVRDVEWTLVI